MKKVISCLSFTLLALFFSGCGSFSVESQASLSDPREIPMETGPPLFVLHYQDTGVRKKDGYILQEARDYLGTLDRPPIVLAFVHGWNHNSDSGDTNYLEFKSLIMRLQEIDSLKDRAIVGIYLGWNGLIRSNNAVPQSGNLFEPRKQVADVIAGKQNLMLDICGISQLVEKQGGKTILVGHSLGGRILESSYKTYLQNGRRIPSNQLAILLNPASSANESLNLRRELKSRGYSSPQIVNLVARDDFVVNTIYRYNERVYSQPRSVENVHIDGYYATSIGFIPMHINHFIDRRKDIVKSLKTHDMALLEKRALRQVERRIRYSHRSRDKLLRLRVEKNFIVSNVRPLSAAIHQLQSEQQLAISENFLVNLAKTKGRSHVRSLRSKPITDSGLPNYGVRVVTLPSLRDDCILTSKTPFRAYPTITAGNGIMSRHSKIGTGKLLSTTFEDLLWTLYDLKFH